MSKAPLANSQPARGICWSSSCGTGGCKHREGGQLHARNRHWSMTARQRRRPGGPRLPAAHILHHPHEVHIAPGFLRNHHLQAGQQAAGSRWQRERCCWADGRVRTAEGGGGPGAAGCCTGRSRQPSPVYSPVHSGGPRRVLLALRRARAAGRRTLVLNRLGSGLRTGRPCIGARGASFMRVWMGTSFRRCAGPAGNTSCQSCPWPGSPTWQLLRNQVTSR